MQRGSGRGAGACPIARGPMLENPAQKEDVEAKIGAVWGFVSYALFRSGDGGAGTDLSTR